MNEKNSLGLNKCFLDLENPIDLFNEWFNQAKKSEINDPNAVALATSGKQNIPSVRMVLLKGFNNNGFIFYTNLEKLQLWQRQEYKILNLGKRFQSCLNTRVY